MRAFNDKERMFPSIESCFAHGVVIGEIARRGWPVSIGVDLSGKTRKGNAIFCAAVDPGTQRRYPLEVQVGNWTSPELAAVLGEMHARYPTTFTITVENNGYQQALIDWIRSSPSDYSYWFKIEAFTTGNNKHAPLVGLPSLEVEFKNKAWVVPADEFEGHPPLCGCGWCVWKREVRDYPMAATTDTVMAMWFCRAGIVNYNSGAVLDGSFGDINVR